uniref:Uncharacterized protein n=1 Tax=Caenorhabditis japonica TaxID=281687 RepID=A0A8R1HXV1_CAEJA
MLILSAQFTASILQLFVIFVPVPAMIAVNKPYFINEVLINVPSFLLVMAQAFSLCFMMVNGAHRNLKIVSGKIGIRRFSPSQLTWTIQNFETTAFKYLVILIAIPSMLTYTLALSRLTYQKLKNRKPSNPEEITGSDESRETICSTLSYVIFDAMFLLYLSPPGLGADLPCTWDISTSSFELPDSDSCK